MEDLNIYFRAESIFFAVELLENVGFFVEKIRVNDINILRSYLKKHLNKEETKKLEKILIFNNSSNITSRDFKKKII